MLWLHIAEMRRQLIPRDEETRSAGRRHWHGADALVRHGGAQRAMKHLRELDPTLRVSNLADWLPIRRPEDLATFADGLRKAGLPE